MLLVGAGLVAAGLFFNGKRIRGLAIKAYIALFFALVLVNSSKILTDVVFPGLLAAKA